MGLRSIHMGEIEQEWFKIAVLKQAWSQYLKLLLYLPGVNELKCKWSFVSKMDPSLKFPWTMH